MSFAVVTNIVTALFCLAVLVQSVRMTRALNAMKDGGLNAVVDALDKSTTQARGVLGELKATLSECGGGERVMREGKEIAEELGVMIGIANAAAERLLEASASANRKAAEASDGDDAGLQRAAVAA